MAHLKAKFEDLGFADVGTFIASGNVLFSSRERDASRLESRIAAHLEKSLGYGVDTFVGTAEEVSVIARSKAFPDEAPPGITVHVLIFPAELAPAMARALAAVRTSDDEFHVVGREFLWLCRIRTPDSKVWQHPAIKAVKLPTMTMRNMTSIRKLAALLSIDPWLKVGTEPGTGNWLAFGLRRDSRDDTVAKRLFNHLNRYHAAVTSAAGESLLDRKRTYLRTGRQNVRRGSVALTGTLRVPHPPRENV